MNIGKVVGTVVASQKDMELQNIPLLLVRSIDSKGKEGKVFVSADATRQAGRGDLVYTIGSKEAARMFRKPLTPVDNAIVGFIDQYNKV